MDRQCSVEGCDRKVVARGLCALHYERATKAGALPPKKNKARGVPCEAPDCDRTSINAGFCRRHYEALRPKPNCNVEGCDQRVKATGLCSIHYKRLRENGTFEPIITPRGAGREFLEGLIGYDGVGCITWPFSRNATGYGTTGHQGGSIGAHRLMCIIAHGEPPTDSHEAAHSCGNGHLGCVAPNHLRWATRQENADDAVAHGTMLRGEDHHYAKLTEVQVLAICADPRRSDKIALDYGVSGSLIRFIQRGEAWGWLTGRDPKRYRRRPGTVKLCEEQVLSICKDERPSPLVASDYGVSPKTIRDIRQGSRWGGLTGRGGHKRKA